MITSQNASPHGRKRTSDIFASDNYENDLELKKKRRRITQPDKRPPYKRCDKTKIVAKKKKNQSVGEDAISLMDNVSVTFPLHVSEKEKIKRKLFKKAPTSTDKRSSTKRNEITTTRNEITTTRKDKRLK